MRKFIYRKLQKSLQKFGIYTQLYSSYSDIYKQLKGKPRVIQEYELRRISNTLKAIDDHKFYTALLRRFVPALENVKIEGIKVIEGGSGKGSFNSYRKVNLEGKVCFEKVFFVSSVEFATQDWFHKNIHPKIPLELIKSPALFKIYKADIIAIAYFDFYNLQPIRYNHIVPTAIEMVRILYAVSRQELISDIILSAPHNIKDYKKFRNFDDRLCQTKKQMATCNIDFVKFQEAADKSKNIITHGDIIEHNIYRDNTVLDWDFFGLFPLGYEAAQMIFGLLTLKRLQNISHDWIENEFKTFISAEDWPDFERNTYYFLCVLGINEFTKGNFKETLSMLTGKLKEYQF